MHDYEKSILAIRHLNDGKLQLKKGIGICRKNLLGNKIHVSIFL